jgi:aspartate aminotransferase
MSVVSSRMARDIAQGSVIRRMFEAGIELKKQYGAEAVCDFSLGNPDLPPPPAAAGAMRELADRLREPGILGYMPNAGFPWALDKLATWLSEQQGVRLERGDVMLSCGAAGALNSFLHAVLEPGDEVLGLAPYFVEYVFYSANHGGLFRAVPTRPDDFGPDLAALEAAITPQTRVLLVNSPNNPSGMVYSADDMRALAALADDASRRNGRPVYLLCDEPYRFLAYDGLTVPPVLPLSPRVVVAGSFAKNYGLAGERIGYLALSPDLEDKKTLMAGLVLASRTLGYVNPPVVGQYLMAAALGTSTDAALAVYAGRRDMLAAVLREAGYEFLLPKGAFYFFPKAPGGDDAAFADRLARQLVLAAPGRGFGCPGHFRLSFAVDEAVIARSLPGFKKAAQG